MSVELAVRTLLDRVDKRIAPVKPFRAIVTSVSGGLVGIRRPEAASGGTALHAKIAGFGVAVGDEVLCVNLGKFPIIIGKIQRVAQTGVVLDSGPGIYYGTGSPEGVVNATVGSVYHETDGATLTTAWFKASGTGAYGWIPVDGFTRYKWEAGWHKDKDTTTVRGKGIADPVVTAATLTSSDTGFNLLTLATSAVANNVASVVTAALVRTTQSYEWATRIFTEATITSVRYWIGLFSGDPSASAAPAVSFAGFRADTSVPDTNWKCITNDGVGPPTIVDSGVAFSASTFYTFRIVETSTLVLFYINEAFVASITTTLPALGSLAHYESLTTLSAAVRSMRVSLANFLLP